jgi:hypothetical protein
MAIHPFFGQLGEEKSSLDVQIRRATTSCLIMVAFICVLAGAIIVFACLSFHAHAVLRNVVIAAVLTASLLFLYVRNYRTGLQKRRLRLDFSIWCNNRMTFLENEYQLAKSKLPFGRELLGDIDWDNLSERLNACEWSLDTMRAFADVMMQLRSDPKYQVPDDDSLHAKYFGSWRK